MVRNEGLLAVVEEACKPCFESGLDKSLIVRVELEAEDSEA